MGLGILLLLGLSLWQWQRLHWKNNLNEARLEASKGEPISLNVGLPAKLADWSPVTINGEWLLEPQVFVLARTAKGGEFGYHAFTPFKSASGEVVIVDRGWLPQDAEGKTLSATNGTIEGYARLGHPKKNIFVPNNEPATGFWSHVDIVKMAQAMGISTPSYYIQATNQTAKGTYPLPQPAQITLKNNHFQYAITWLALAFTLLGMFVIGSLKKKKS